MDQKSHKVVPVRVVLLGNPAKGFSIVSVTSNPANLKIEGAKKELDRIRAIKTEPVDIEGINEDLRVQVKIDPEGRIFRTEKDIVEVNVAVKRK